MKSIYNYKKASVADIESDGLLAEATKLHVLSFQMLGKEIKSFHGVDETARIKALFQWHIDTETPIVMHNGIGFDVPLVEKLLGMDLSKVMIIDTLALSWYLNVGRKIHGLDSFFDDYGIAKPKVEDWVNGDYEEYRNRCVEDVKINQALWKDLIARLEDMYTLSKEQIDLGVVGGARVTPDEVIYVDQFKGISVEDHINRILTFLMYKMDCARLQEKTMWEVDVNYVEQSKEQLTTLIEKAAKELEAVMPKVAKYASRKQPAKPFKKNGELSTSGENWEKMKALLISEEKDEYGNLKAKVVKQGEIHELTAYEEPNIGSGAQVKDFLFSKGWVPETFKYVRDKEAFEDWIQSKPPEGSRRGAWTHWNNSRPVDRDIPQVSKDGEEGKELCESVLRLAERVPEVQALENYSMIESRLGIIKGFLKNLKDGKFLQARIGGFTNTLRVKHSEIVNLPKASKPFAEAIRGGLIAGEGKISLGSDLSGIEDRVKHHFMIPHDPKYVATMMEDDYDPHLATALASGNITKEQAEGYKLKTLTGAVKDVVAKWRALGKTVNYASVYKAGAAKIAQTAGITKEQAEKMLEGYWALNWSVLEIEKEQVTITCSKGLKWLINPMNGMLYSLRSEKDKFSTLAQGTGSFLFDMWVDEILERQQAKWGRKTMTAAFHDEGVWVIRDTEKFKQEMQQIVLDSIDAVSVKYMLRRKLGCEVQFGKRYSDIH